MSQDLYEAPDYLLMDELLTEEHKLIRDSAREWVKREVSPIIEEDEANNTLLILYFLEISQIFKNPNSFV